jgi:hypothetical protein
MTRIAGAATITFADFSSTAGLTLNGSATNVNTAADGWVLRLVPATTSQSGSAFSTASINANQFSTAFDFRLTNPGGITDSSGQTGADGFVFVVQNVSSSIGGSGGGLGYQGIGSSVGVEFDTWRNLEFSDQSSNHLGIDVNGSVTSVQATDVSPLFDNGGMWTAWIDYNGSLLEVRVSNTGVRPLLPTMSRIIDIQSIIGSPTAFVGFTAGTGAAFANHDILSWTYTDFQTGGVDPGVPPGAVPEPGTLLLLGTGALGLARRMRRQTAARQA